MLLAEQRRVKILELLEEEGSARVSYLSKTFDVSEPTIRQDLEKLEAEGYIVREHGGAFLKSVPQQVGSLSLQHQENIDKKSRIGKKATEFIEDWDSIILDSGSTVTEVAKNLTEKQHLKIITNALNIALMLGSHPFFEVHVTGGEFKAPTLSLTGEKAAGFFRQLHVDKLFLASAGISWKAGLTYPGLSDLPVKKAMIESASEVYLVADSTKIGNAAFASLGGLELIHYFITDDGISEEDKKMFESKGVRVIIA
ncbi:transcriptional regulator, DeoR family [Candidatus Moduliflexus flocculans]|uniref:Transcriptional regulator, DeoR family n=1 Tax=Candidatus Moduliflexus flocculans TaxID=1499966 RepID=A0A0S6W3B4_9BACT|nr:transcriptional regulator, DeoR family [Candidatus Moduliflexus flocculans]